MDRPLQRTGIINLLTLAALTVAVAVTGTFAPSLTSETGLAFLVLGVLVCAISWFQMRLAANEEAERLELEDLARSRSKSTLFDAAEAESFPARRSREQFDRWVVPTLTLILFLLEAGAAWWLYGHLNRETGSRSAHAAIGGSIHAGIALVLLLVGLYASKLAQYAGLHLLRPGGASLLMGFLVTLSAAVAEGLDYFGYAQWDTYFAWTLWGLLVLVAVEKAFALVFEAYRPRVKGRETRLIYESRLIGLLAQPTGLFSTAAQALDYQFGFKVSETWFFQFLQRALGALLLVQGALLLLLTCIVVIEPGEQALLERFGRPVSGREVLNPGLHLKAPWPVDRIHRFDARRIQTLNIGFVPEDEAEHENTLLWTRSHYKEEFNMLVASREQLNLASESEQTVPVNLLTVSIPVQFQVKDIRAWAYGHSDPLRLLEHLANREVVRYLAGVDMETVMSHGRQQAATDLRSRIAAAADASGLGVDIVFVGLQDIHPPVGQKELQVAAAYEQVIGAEQDREARILSAEGDALADLPQAQATAAQRTNAAAAAAVRKVSDAIGRAGQFTNQIRSYTIAPAVYTARNYFETFAAAAAGARKYVIIPTNTHGVVTLNLEDKIRPDLLDVPIKAPGDR